MSLNTASADTVLRLLRQLPPRDRLHVVNQILPELEQDLPLLSAPHDFWRNADLAALAEAQSVYAVDNFQALLGGWPEEESLADFLASVRAERQRSRVMDDRS
jgi:hypothetical protein